MVVKVELPVLGIRLNTITDRVALNMVGQTSSPKSADNGTTGVWKKVRKVKEASVRTIQ